MQVDCDALRDSVALLEGALAEAQGGGEEAHALFTSVQEGTATIAEAVTALEAQTERAGAAQRWP